MSAAPPSATEAPAKPKSKKGLIIIIAAVLVLGGGGAGAFFMMGGKEDPEKTEAAEAVKHEPKAPPLFVAMDPPFVVNFEPGAPARFLQIAIQFMTRDPHLATELEHLSPRIRNDLLIVFGNKTVADVSTQEGKEALRSATLEAVRKIIAEEGGKPEILEAVYFTSFVMQ